MRFRESSRIVPARRPVDRTWLFAKINWHPAKTSYLTVILLTAGSSFLVGNTVSRSNQPVYEWDRKEHSTRESFHGCLHSIMTAECNPVKYCGHFPIRNGRFYFLYLFNQIGLDRDRIDMLNFSRFSLKNLSTKIYASVNFRLFDFCGILYEKSILG